MIKFTPISDITLSHEQNEKLEHLQTLVLGIATSNPEMLNRDWLPAEVFNIDNLLTILASLKLVGITLKINYRINHHKELIEAFELVPVN